MLMQMREFVFLTYPLNNLQDVHHLLLLLFCCSHLLLFFKDSASIC